MTPPFSGRQRGDANGPPFSTGEKEKKKRKRLVIAALGGRRPILIPHRGAHTERRERGSLIRSRNPLGRRRVKKADR